MIERLTSRGFETRGRWVTALVSHDKRHGVLVVLPILGGSRSAYDPISCSNGVRAPCVSGTGLERPAHDGAVGEFQGAAQVEAGGR